MRKLRFNMIEITLALLVMSVAVVSIFGLIPIGVKAHSNAVHNNLSADVAQEFLHVLSYQLRRNWLTLTASIPDESSLSSNLSLSGVSTSIGSGDWKAMPAMFPDMYFVSSDSTFDGSAGDKWIFRVVRQRSVPNVPPATGNRSVTDFDAVIRIWRSPVKGWIKNDSGVYVFSTVSTSDTVKLNAEVSWPGSAAYEDRTKAYYTFEVTR